MQVNVFIEDVDGNEGQSPRLLILPVAPDAAIPVDFRSGGWTYFATTSTDDKLLGAPAGKVEADIASKGFSVVQPTG